MGITAAVAILLALACACAGLVALEAAYLELLRALWTHAHPCIVWIAVAAGLFAHAIAFATIAQSFGTAHEREMRENAHRKEQA